MQELSTLNDKTAPNYAANVVKMVEQYGPIVMLYDLYSNEDPSKIKKTQSFSGQPSAKAVVLSSSSVSMPDNYRFPVGLHDFVIKFEIKQIKQIKENILKDINYQDINYQGAKPFIYIPDFEGNIISPVKEVLSESFIVNEPNKGNIYTIIMIKKIGQDRQRRIYDYINTIWSSLRDSERNDTAINNIAAEVRKMLTPSLAAASSSSSATQSLYSTVIRGSNVIGSNVKGFSRNPTGKSIEAGVEAGVATVLGKRKEGGRRRSRHYRKKRSTLKRRRIRRRRLTRKGRKRRHTKRR